MQKLVSAGLFVGVGGTLGGVLLFAIEFLRHSNAPMRVWNLLQWLGMDLPAPANPLLLGPTLALLNVPLWAVACSLGLLVAASSWLMRSGAR